MKKAVHNIKGFDVNLLNLTDGELKILQETVSLVTFDKNNYDFHTEGLFSTEIFGKVGSKERNILPSFIKLNIPILHPLAYEFITTLNSLYKDIMTGDKYAVWDKDINDFKVSDEDNGKTGFAFFISKIKEIKFADTNSSFRQTKINFIKNIPLNEMIIQDFAITPAGMRDYSVDEKGFPSEDEVNSIYRGMIAANNLLGNTEVNDLDHFSLDPLRERIQNIAYKIYKHYIGSIKGKKGFLQNKWNKRGVAYGTRNVMVALPYKIERIKEEKNVGYNDTVIGVLQLSKAVLPLTLYKTNTMFSNRIFSPNTNRANLVDPKTLESVEVEVDNKYINRWTTGEGVNNVLNSLLNNEIMLSPIKIGDHYLVNIYEDGKELKIVYDTKELPESYDRKYVRPITYLEFFYLCLHDEEDNIAGACTRFPVVGLGSSFPTMVYLKPTTTTKKLKLYSSDSLIEKTIYEYPDLSSPIFNGISPHITKLARMGGDYDGDMITFIAFLTGESVREIKRLLKTRSFYIDPSGKLTYKINNGIIDKVVSALNKEY